ncbi:MAG: chromosome segregation protein SMC, partial [Candidatus Eremiobacteraeota bacterium]|nr:chromosome segregation protein SMC [Candidatus Eremiobacteraeota bacterium]
MRLKSLRLFGFKTFADQTVLPFEPGITGLVGPNGSGKSNLVDAIRWALGEQHPRSLRSTKTEDVIFAGNDRRRPLGMAEVSITFDNASGTLPIDYREVQITRRAYRAGESEFYINRTQVRLRDIVELLMGTGLGHGSVAIVSQGQIDAFLSEKPTERRSLFEETAGINKFLARKAESLRRLEQTEQNGIRISDLLSEITARIPELETQVRRARRYRRATARLRDLEILTYVRSTASRRDERERVQQDFAAREALRAAAAGRGAALEAQLSALRTELYGTELQLEERRADATAARAGLAELEAERAAMVARRDALLSQSSGIADDRERAEAERQRLERSLQELEKQIAPHVVALPAHEARETAARDAVTRTRRELDEIYTALRDVEVASASDAASEAERRANLQALRAELERLDREAAAARDDTLRNENDAESLRSTLRQIQQSASDLEERVAAAASALSSTDARVADVAERRTAAHAAARTASGELAAAEATLQTILELEANLEGHAAGTRAILEAHARGEHRGILGVVSNLVRVDEAYARALDIAFGPSLSFIVTQTAQDAQAAIEHLSAQRLGRATFLPLDILGNRQGRDPASAPHRPGVVGYAHSLVTTKPSYAGIVAFLVGRILIVEDLRVGLQLVRSDGFRDTIVTLEGEQISGGGAMTGGRFQRERAILSRRAHADTLRNRLPTLRARLAEADAELATAVAEHEAALLQRDDARNAQGDAALALRDTQARVREVETALERVRAAAQEARTRADALEKARGDVESRRLTLERRAGDPSVLQAERERLEAAFAEAREDSARTQDEERAASAQLAAAREALGTLIARRDAERARSALLDSDTERATLARQQMQAELETLAQAVEQAESSLVEARQRVERADAAVHAVRAERDALTARAGAAETELRSSQGEERAAAAQTDDARLRLAEIEAELGMLASGFAQNPATAEECADVERRYANEQGDFSADVARLREELTRLSTVNLNAEEERDRLAERERFLREQLDDLTKARETLLASIAEIEATSQLQFNETFALVQRAFHEMFPRLFPGGEARMWQTNPQSLSETGIEISVQPPGKKMTPLQALSGGERAMT